jgi:hypothetical protein
MSASEKNSPERIAAVGLCAACLYSRQIASARGSLFLLCQLSVTDARFPKYPRLPVSRCLGFRPGETGNSGDT